MSLNPFNESNRDGNSKILSYEATASYPRCVADLRPTMYENAPPSLMSMSMPIPQYETNQHDDYGNGMHSKIIDETFDLSMVTNEIPYYDLPAGLMCLLVKVSTSKNIRLHRAFCVVACRMQIVITIRSMHTRCACCHRRL